MTLNEINKGIVPNMGLTMYRKFDSFKPLLFVDGLTVSSDSYIEVYYKEYLKDLNGKKINEVLKHYVVCNIPAKIGVDENDQEVELIPAWNGFNLWYGGTARTPITNTTGLIDAVEYTLSILPQDVINGYKLKSWA
jgi:hypothetical protein